MQEPDSRKFWRRMALTLAIGAVGGALFWWLELPLAWMLGAMTFCAVAAMTGLPLVSHKGLRGWVVAALGVIVGSSFTPETLERAAQWPAGLAALSLYVFLLFLVGYVLMVRFGRVDGVTAFFAAMPGGINEMVRVAEEHDADISVVSLTHAVRIYTVVFLIPFYLHFVVGHVVGSTVAATAEGAASGGGILDVAIMIGCAVIGYPLARRLRLPGAPFIGPIALAATAYIEGWITLHPPVEVIAFVQLLSGAMMGARFAGVSLRRLARIIVLAVVSAVFMLVAAVAASPLFSALTGAPPTGILLALVPGGFTEMGLVAISLGLDAALVAVFHILRVVYVIVLAPVLFRWYLRRKQVSAQPNAGD